MRPEDVKKYLEAAKYSQEVVILTLESHREDYDKMCNRKMSLHENHDHFTALWTWELEG